jgi:hypothetical protein
MIGPVDWNASRQGSPNEPYRRDQSNPVVVCAGADRRGWRDQSNPMVMSLTELRS